MVMKIEQAVWTKENGWSNDIKKVQNLDTQLIMFFGSTNKLKRHDFIDGIKSTYPKAHILGCSTAGEIYGTQVLDDSIVATFIEFEKSSFMGSCVKLKDVDSSYHAGERLAKSIDKEGLVHVFVLSDGTGVNGSELVNGLARNLPKGVAITGGLAGNGEHFEKTLVFWDETPKKNNIAIVGFYGKNLRVGYGSMGGWDPFGPERLITKSDGNVLYELDGRSALEIYKVYLGGHASGLPATGLFFPLQIRTTKGEDRIVRTILSINEDNRSMTFAGDMPEGAYARFMKANFERIIDGSNGAAKETQNVLGFVPAELAILISCVGRKLVLRQRTEEEVEAVRDVLGRQAFMTGFYSYGEIAPFGYASDCALHNQTMTITAFTEV